MPVKGRVKVLLTIENILRRTTEYDIYKHYLKQDFLLNKPIHSPFRDDENPSFTIVMGRNNKLHHLDYGDSTYSGDVLNFVCQLFNNITTSQALMKIDHDLNLGITIHDPKAPLNSLERVKSNIILEPKKHSLLQVVSRKFDSAELAYWNSYHISKKMLEGADIYAVKTLYLDRKRYPMRNDLCFAYLFMVDGKAKWKIYWPERQKGDKWLSNVPNTSMSGMDKIHKGDEYVIITKAKKDELVLSLFLPKVCSVQNESIYSINEDNLSILKECPNSFVNFDNDETGIKACKFYNQYGLKWINCPSSYKDPKGKVIKDFADLGRYYGIETVMAYFKKKHIPFHELLK